MDYQDLRILKILEEIEDGKMPSQRELAKKLNISLGLVNAFIKRLAQKGYFKIRTIPKNRVRYIITPKGAAEKTRLTYEYILYSYRFYKDARKRLQAAFEDLVKKGVKKVVFFGLGEFAEIAYISIQEVPIEITGAVDEKRAGQSFFNLLILEPSNLNHLVFDRVLITAEPGKDDPVIDAVKQFVSEDMIVNLNSCG